jgi:hypothetical protein
MLSDLGDADQLAELADAGDLFAALRLADLLASRGDVTQLTDRADRGGLFAADRLCSVLVARGEFDGVRVWQFRRVWQYLRRRLRDWPPRPAPGGRGARAAVPR